ncbi:MAG: pitrilysin family protein [Cyanobacteria bacterium P01_F01_bin.153]
MTQLPQSPVLQRRTLSNGLTVIAIENPAAEIVAARIFVRAGGLRESQSQAGVAHLCAATLTKGTQRLSSLEIAEQVESVGASLGADASTDYFLVTLKTVRQDFDGILELAGEVLRSPSFPPEQIDLERKSTIQAIRSQREQPFSLAFQKLQEITYGGAHPYGRSTLGTEKTLEALTSEDLHAFHRAFFRPDNAVVSVSGCLPAEDAIARIESVLGDWAAPEGDIHSPVLPEIATKPHPTMVSQETQQSIIILGYLTAALETDTSTNNHRQYLRDYGALKLASTYLGNGLSSRLFVELREKRGLAYDVSAFYPTRLEQSMFGAYIGTAPDNTAIALDGLRAEVDRLAAEPLTAESLQVSKNKLLGQYALGKQTNSQLAQLYGWYDVLGLGVGFDQEFQQLINEVTIDDVQRVAQTYLAVPYVSLVGPAAAVEPVLAQAA